MILDIHIADSVADFTFKLFLLLLVLYYITKPFNRTRFKKYKWYFIIPTIVVYLASWTYIL